MEEELVSICLGGKFYDVPKSIAKSIFNTVLETPPIDHEKYRKEADDIADKIRQLKEDGNY